MAGDLADHLTGQPAPPYRDCLSKRAGLSPVRYLRTVAQSSTNSMRLRTRLIVSFLVAQCGSMIVMTWPMLTWRTSMSPITG